MSFVSQRFIAANVLQRPVLLLSFGACTAAQCRRSLIEQRGRYRSERFAEAGTTIKLQYMHSRAGQAIPD